MTIEVAITNKGDRSIRVIELEPQAGQRNMEGRLFEREHTVAPGETFTGHIYNLRDLRVAVIRDVPPAGTVS